MMFENCWVVRAMLTNEFRTPKGDYSTSVFRAKLFKDQKDFQKHGYELSDGEFLVKLSNLFEDMEFFHRS